MRSDWGPCSGGAGLAKQNALPIVAAMQRLGRVAAGWSAGLELHHASELVTFRICFPNGRVKALPLISRLNLAGGKCWLI